VDITQELWVEKFRPTSLDELVMQDEYKDIFTSCIKNKEVSNFLFVGPPGSGKSTLARLLVSKNGILNNRDNLLEINGSAKSTRGISFVDDVIEPFLKVPPSSGDKYRIVYIDECDFLTDQSFHSQRSIIEKYSRFGRFIFTANYLSKIPDAVQSRFQVFAFKQLPFQFIVEYCLKILNSQEIKYTNEDVNFIISNLYPDVRKIVNLLQRNSTSKELKISRQNLISNEKNIISNIVELISTCKNKDYSKINTLVDRIIKLLDDPVLEYRNMYVQLFFRDEIPANSKVIVNKYSSSHSNCLIPSMNFLSMVFEIIKCLQEYNRLSS
jgi:replication factor C small subunit